MENVSPAPAIERLMKRREVEQMVGLSCAAIYARMDAGTFPRPVRIGTGPNGAVAWRLSDVQDWIRTLPVADPKAPDAA